MQSPRTMTPPSAPAAETTAPAHAGTLAYRADIDGLRGIAVLLVMLYHFGVAPFSGGYIGVDIFFVISGFLITGILAGETRLRAGLNRFYARRIRRLAPMFLLVTATTTLFAIPLLLPADFTLYLGSLRDALAQKSNLFFAKDAADYFGHNAQELPLLHTWSLSVEWQFYLLFPALQIIAQRHLSRQGLRYAIAALTLAAAAWSIHAAAGSHTTAYFSTGARIVEFLIGALIATLPAGMPARALRAGALIAVGSLVVLAIVFTPATSFPGTNAILVCLLTGICLLGGAGSRMLGTPWLVHVGKVSYSAYLWHWPLIAFLTYLQLRPSMPVALLLIVAIIALSSLSYAKVELPFRKRNTTLGKLLLCCFLLPVIVAAAATALSKKYHGFPHRLGAEAVHAHQNLLPYMRSPVKQCHDFSGDNIEECAIGDRESGEKALLIGDSHARHYIPFVDVAAREAGVKVYALTNSECLILPDAPALQRSRDAQCAAARERNYALIREGGFKHVLIGQRWIGYAPSSLKTLDAALEMIERSGARAIVLGPVPENGRDTKDCFYRHIKLRQPYQDICAIPLDEPYSAEAKAYAEQLFKTAQARHPNAMLIDPKRILCAEGRCATVHDGTPLYDDTHHINGFASTYLATQYLPRFGNPFRPARPAD